ncbi:hypothetical protein AX768_19855 [Burkholderia sp. PAMC 28687]|nr:hypothetical protein AX768_19855 [Burkholderia sp. PAMC 28687]
MGEMATRDVSRHRIYDAANESVISLHRVIQLVEADISLRLGVKGIRRARQPPYGRLELEECHLGFSEGT